MKLNIKTKLFFLTTIPTLIIVVLSIIGVVYELNDKKNLIQTKNYIVEVQATSEIIHFMQIERGLSVGFIANHIYSKDSKLITTRKNLDKVLKNEQNLSFLKTLQVTRESIDNFKISTFEVKEYYTQKIASLLDFVKIIPTLIKHTKDRNYIQAYSHLSLAKESLGQIRAILNEVFVSNMLSKENLIQAKECLNTYHISIDMFKITLHEHPELIDLYQKNLNNKVVEETFKILQFTLQKADAVEFGIEPTYWFNISTQNINMIKKIEEHLFYHINESINKKIKNSIDIIILITIAILFLLIVLGIFMRTIIKKILSSTNLLNEEFENSLILLEQYKSTVDSSFIVSKTDAKGIIRYVNDAFCKISGYSRDELLGKPHNIIRHPDMSKEIFKEMWHTIKDCKKSWVGDIKNRAKDGSTYWMKASINPIIDKNGNIIEYIAIRTDISELQEEKERIRNTLGITVADFTQARHLAKEYENAIDSTWCVMRTDINNNITYINDTFSKISGYTKEELIGINCIELRDKKHLNKKDCENIQNMLTSKEIVQLQFANISKDKKLYHLDATIVPIIDTYGNVIEYLHLMCDITELISIHMEIERTQQEIICLMGEISESRNKETGNHIYRVANYSKLLAIKAGFDEKEANLIAQASPMHDIGKVAVPDAILLKPGSLNEDEWKIMQSHSEIGYRVLNKSQRPLLNAAAVIAKEHHEKYDGSGYPDKISGENIHIYARIVAIADVFDALGSDRVYKKAWSIEAILKFFQENKNRHFDGKLVEYFLNNIDEFLEIRDRYKDDI